MLKPNSRLKQQVERPPQCITLCKSVPLTQEGTGMDAEQKEVRGQLFDLSGLRGKYPQVPYHPCTRQASPGARRAPSAP